MSLGVMSADTLPELGRSTRGGPCRRIVVVDNDPDALELAVTDLTLEGHDVVGRGIDGESGIRLCRELRPDVLVVDLRMPPGPDGLKVVAALRDLEGLRFILYTNYQSARLRRDTAAVGATFLPKGELSALRAAVMGDRRR